MRIISIFLFIFAAVLVNKVEAATCTATQCSDTRNPPGFTGQTTWEHTFDFPDGVVATEADVAISLTALSDMRIHVLVSNERGFDPSLIDPTHQLGWSFFERNQGGVIRKDFMTSEQIDWLNDGGDIFVHLLVTDTSNNVMSYSADIGIARMNVQIIPIPGALWLFVTALGCFVPLARRRVIQA